MLALNVMLHQPSPGVVYNKFYNEVYLIIELYVKTVSTFIPVLQYYNTTHVLPLLHEI